MSHFLSECSTRAGRSAGYNATSNCLILQYRRVALLAHDPLRLAVPPHNFERQMEYLATNFNVVSLQEVGQHLETATPWPDRTVAVTFDGGYSDVLYVAKEILERFEVPATVFVPSANLIERTRFWWDVLEDLLVTGDARGLLTLEIEEETHHWSMASQRDRFRAFDDLYGILLDKAPSRQQEITTEIVRSLSKDPKSGIGGLGFCAPGEDLDHHATLSAQELQTLEEGGLVTVGGHTHHCAKLSRLSEPEQRNEIEYNKRILEEVLGHCIEYFAYPYGDEGSYTAATRTILNDCGFRLACRVACDSVRLTEADKPYELPRLRIQDWNPYTFHRYLETFLG